VWLLVPYGSLPAADALVVLHQVDPEAAKVPLKKYDPHLLAYIYLS
jgi:hypothetical protein